MLRRAQVNACIPELFQCAREGFLHPRQVLDGRQLAKIACLETLTDCPPKSVRINRFQKSAGEFRRQLAHRQDLLPDATFPRGRYADLKASLDMPSRLVAPIEKGKQIGTLKVTLDGKPLLERPLIALAAGDEGGFFKRMSDGAWMWFKGDAGANVSADAPKAQ